MTGRASKVKGANGEREVVAALREAGYDAHRTPHSGALGWMPGDAIGTPWFIEVKRCETLRIPEWCRKAEEQAGDSTALVVFRRSHEPWRVVLRLDEFLQLVEQTGQNRGQ